MAAAARALEALHLALTSASRGDDDTNCAEILERILDGDYEHQLPADLGVDVKPPHIARPVRRRRSRVA